MMIYEKICRGDMAKEADSGKHIGRNVMGEKICEQWFERRLDEAIFDEALFIQVKKK